MSPHRLARASAAVAFLLILAGGSVTSTGSSLAVPDWPLSFGQAFPAMRGGVFFEHGHRLLAGTTAVLAWILTGWLLRVERRGWVRRAALAASGAIVVQALLGGVTVLYGLPPQVSILHACLGQAIFCLLVAVAQATAPGFGTEPSATPWTSGATAAAAVFGQLILGAVLRHTGLGLPWHMAGALAAFGAVSWTAYLGAVSSDRALRGPSLWLAALILAQIFLGVGALLGRSLRAIAFSALLPTLHQTCGAAILALCVVWTLRALPPGENA